MRALVAVSLTFQRLAIVLLTPVWKASPANPSSVSRSPMAVLQALRTSSSTGGVLQPRARI